MTGRTGRRLHRELDVGQHGRAPALRHQQRAPLAGRLDGERLAVDQPQPGSHRVDAQPGAGQVEEGQRPDAPPRRPPGQHCGVLGPAGRPSARPPSANPGRHRRPDRRTASPRPPASSTIDSVDVVEDPARPRRDGRTSGASGTTSAAGWCRVRRNTAEARRTSSVDSAVSSPGPAGPRPDDIDARGHRLAACHASPGPVSRRSRSTSRRHPTNGCPNHPGREVGSVAVDTAGRR